MEEKLYVYLTQAKYELSDTGLLNGLFQDQLIAARNHDGGVTTGLTWLIFGVILLCLGASVGLLLYGVNTKIVVAVSLLSLVVLTGTLTASRQVGRLLQVLPQEDVYALRMIETPKENAFLVSDGLYEFQSIEETDFSYIVTLNPDGNGEIIVNLLKENYAIEKSVDVDTDTVATLQTVLDKQTKL